MADFDPHSVQSENSSNFDNDFEKLDPMSDFNVSLPDNLKDDLISSTSPAAPMSEEPDIYSASSEAEAAEPLVSFGDEPAPTVTPLVTFDEPVKEEEPQEPEYQYDFEPEAEVVPAPVPVSQVPDSSTFPETEPEPMKESSPPPVKKAEPAKKGTDESWMKKVDPRVMELIYWRDIKKSGVVFASLFILLLSLALFSVLSVAAYLSLAVLCVTTSFVVYKKVLGAVQKTGEGHTFKEYLEKDISLPEDKVHDLADSVMKHVQCTIKELRRLFLVEDLVDTLKFGILLWVLTYFGAWFNGMTLIILGLVGVFTLPKVYETYKVQIDQYVDLAKTQFKNIMKTVQEKIPLPGKKKQQ